MSQHKGTQCIDNHRDATSDGGGLFVVLQVAVSDRAAHTSTLVRQLTNWALSPVPSSDAAAAAAAASQMQQQLRLQEQRGAAGLLDGGSGSDGSRARQQQLLQLPFNAAEESVVVAVLRERMSAGKMGGHLLPLYLLQVSWADNNTNFTWKAICKSSSN